MATNSQNKQALSILIGYNVPIILWTLGALVQGSSIGGTGWTCPLDYYVDWCPSCGFTRAYAALLYHGQIVNWYFFAVICIFYAVTISSIVKSYRIFKKGQPAAV